MVGKDGKKANESKNTSENKDLTRIEDLSEFFHQEDTGINDRFSTFSADGSDSEESSNVFDEPPAIPADTDEELEESEVAPESIEEESSEEHFSFDESTDSDDLFAQTDSEEISLDIPESTENFHELEPEEIQDYIQEETSFHLPPEKFEDVKTFAQNFSYGQVQGAGNPPYSMIVRHIKFKEDAEHIMELLREFALITEQNEAETTKALEYGSLLIPQISEYCAIILAHKLRRFDLDLEVGLSDEIHPSKEEGGNPRGLLKKDSLKQNKSESFKLKDIGTSIKDIIVSTSSSIAHHVVKEYLGVQTVFAIVEENELEKLQYVQKTEREKSPLFNYDSSETNPLTTAEAFKDYQNSFAYIYEDLTNQLKQKAFKEKANALLGVNFQLSPLQFSRSDKRISAYQITGSATLAVVMKEVP